MNNIYKARAVLASLPRCAAKSRQSGEQCKNPGLGAGGKCRFHGGASTGRPPTHGRLTKANLLNRDWVRLLLGVLVLEHPGFKVSWFNPGSMTAARASEVLQQKLNRPNKAMKMPHENWHSLELVRQPVFYLTAIR